MAEDPRDPVIPDPERPDLGAIAPGALHPGALDPEGPDPGAVDPGANQPGAFDFEALEPEAFDFEAAEGSEGPARPRRPPAGRPRLAARAPRVRSRAGVGPRRGAILLTIVSLLIIGGLIDRSGAEGAAGPAPSPSVPAVAAQAALSSSWFCAGATGPAGSAAAGSLLIANPTASTQSATVTIVASTGPSPAPTTLSIPAGSRRTVAEVLPTPGAWAAATVTLDGGGGVVEQELHSSLGIEVSPCATAGSSTWYLPSGTTLRNADEVVSLYNPYPGDAIADLSFVTDQGPEAPGDFQAILVPGDSVVPVDLASHLRRRVSIATSVSVRTGRLVAWATQIITPPSPGTPTVGQGTSAGSGLSDPAPAVGGVSSTLGAASLSTNWFWPDGVSGGGVVEQYVVYNPGSAPAALRLSLTLDQGGAESFPFTVGAQSVTTVSTSQQIRLPAGIAHDATLTATNGVPVVAERVVSAAAPSSRSGIGQLIGAQVTARTWVLGAGTPGRSTDEWIELQNPGKAAVQASIEESSSSGSAAIPGLAKLSVGAGGRVAVHLTGRAATAAAGPLVVSATGDLVVERDLYGSATRGIALALGVPNLAAH